MNTISENLQRLVNAKTSIANAITAKGGTVNEGDGFEDFATDIDSIPEGGGSIIVRKNELLLNAAKPKKTILLSRGTTWYRVSISGSFAGPEHVWSDNYNVYCSYDGDNKVFDRANLQWLDKSWNGLTSFDGRYVWSDGDNVYYSYGADQYVLDRSTSTWTEKLWSGLTSFNGDCVWASGGAIYYSAGQVGSTTYQKILNKSTSTWSNMTWSAPSNYTYLYGRYIWSDGTSMYYSTDSYYSKDYTVSSYQWVLSYGTWYNITWSSNKPYSGDYVWSDGKTVYYSGAGGFQYTFGSGTTWNSNSWSGGGGEYLNAKTNIWSDGFDIYQYYGGISYKLGS